MENPVANTLIDYSLEKQFSRTLTPQVLSLVKNAEEKAMRTLKSINLSKFELSMKNSLLNSPVLSKRGVKEKSKLIEISFDKVDSIKKDSLLINDFRDSVKLNSGEADFSIPQFRENFVKTSNKSARSSTKSKQVNQKVIDFAILEANALLSQGKLGKCVEVLSNLQKKGIKHADAFYIQGEAYRRAKNLKTAETFFLQCKKFNHFPNKVLFSQGLLAFELGRYLEALEFFKEFNEANVAD